ncbi:MAG: MFS transporter, partial [Chloroflexi bacterium]|nr:MFS transporter [Chloroflexota bacterium]
MTQPPPPPSLSPFAIFRNRNFSLMWSGQLVSTAGSALTSLACSILIFRLTGSALSVGLMLMATAAPSLLVGLIAGVFVDRFDRKRIMLAADGIRAVLVFLIPILVPFNIAWLYVLVILSSAVGQFYDPAHESVLPEVASEEELASANSLMAISSFGSTAIGFAASGLIASRFPIQWAFYLDAFSFLFSAACILLIRIKALEVVESSGVKMVLRNLKTGIRFLFGNPALRSLFLVAVPTLVAFGLTNALLLPFALRALHATEFEYGLQEGLTSLGFVVGSLLMARWFDRMREGAWIAVSFAGMALAGIFYSLAGSVALAISIQIVSGFLNAPSSIGRRLVIQRNTPREMRGRVNSAFFVSRDVLFLVGMAAAGLADVIDVRILYLVSSLIVLGAAVWALYLPGLRQDAAEWRRMLGLLRSASTAPGLGAGRLARPADMEALFGLLPVLAGLSEAERKDLAGRARLVEAPAGTTVVRFGEVSDAAFFILAGRAVAGVAQPDGSYRSLSTMTPGDFFGEIGALTGAPRTANVAADQPLTLLQVPAEALRKLMARPAPSQLFLAKINERLSRA